MAASITVHLQIFNCPQLLSFSTDSVDETGIKMHVLIRSFLYIGGIFHQGTDPDQTPHFAASDLGLSFLPMSHKKDCRL